MSKTSPYAQYNKLVSDDEINLRLRLLTKTENIAIFTRNTDRCRSNGITNHQLWFKQNGIEIYLDTKHHQWKVVPVCQQSHDTVRAIKKPSLLQIRSIIPFDVVTVASDAHIDPLIIYNMLHDQPVAKGHAMRVLGVISKLAGKEYTLDNTTIVVFS